MTDNKRIEEHVDAARLSAAEGLLDAVAQLREQLAAEDDPEVLIKAVKVLRDVAEPRKDDKTSGLATVNITIGLDGTIQGQQIKAAEVPLVEEVSAPVEHLPAPDDLVTIDLGELLGMTDAEVHPGSNG
jgi:hypothetical protein